VSSIILSIVIPQTHCEPYVIVLQIAWCQKFSMLIEDTLMKSLVWWIIKFETGCRRMFYLQHNIWLLFFLKTSSYFKLYAEPIMILNYFLVSLVLSVFLILYFLSSYSSL